MSVCLAAYYRVKRAAVPAAFTVIAFTVLAVSPSASLTVRRMFLTPAPENVNGRTLPLPTAQLAPPAPSLPSSVQV
jgi:hypothetical protein